jgi:hypothetical protein
MSLRKRKKKLKDDDISVREKTVDQLAMKNDPKSLKILIGQLFFLEQIYHHLSIFFYVF